MEATGIARLTISKHSCSSSNALDLTDNPNLCINVHYRMYFIECIDENLILISL